MNGICAGGHRFFIDQMASLLQTDAAGLNEYAKNYKSLYTIAARCGVFAKSDIQPLINEGATKGRPFGIDFPGGGESDHQRTGLREAYQGHVASWEAPSFSFRTADRLCPNTEAG